MRLVSYTRTTSWKENGDIPADIIRQQNESIRSYAKIHEWKLMKTYSDRKNDDNEESAFRQMLCDGMNRKFDAVIIHSIDRAGKSLWSAKEVLLQTFHMAGIGFVIVQDDFISVGKPNDEAAQYFENHVNQQHIKKIQLGMQKKVHQGLLHWSDVKYGYKLTPEKQLAINDETAKSVRRIFQLCADGHSLQETAEILAKEKVLTPIAVKGTSAKVTNPYHWTDYGVKNIIRNTAYIGYWKKTVQGKEIVYYNEPLVTEDLFEKAQMTIKTIPPRKKQVKSNHIFSNLIVDEEKGGCLSLKMSRKNGERYFMYAERKYRNPLCNKSRLNYQEVVDVVKDVLKREKEAAGRALEYIQKEGKNQKELRVQAWKDALLKQSLQLANAQKAYAESKNQPTKEKNSESTVGILKHYQEIGERTETLFRQMYTELEQLEIAYTEDNPWVQLFLSYDDQKELTNEYLKKYIQKVSVDKLETITVITREEQWKQILQTEAER